MHSEPQQYPVNVFWLIQERPLCYEPLDSIMLLFRKPACLTRAPCMAVLVKFMHYPRMHPLRSRPKVHAAPLSCTYLQLKLGPRSANKVKRATVVHLSSVARSNRAVKTLLHMKLLRNFCESGRPLLRTRNPLPLRNNSAVVSQL
jgi:hypothetical protein